MMKKLKKIFIVAAWILIITGTGVLLGFSYQRHNLRRCVSMDVIIDYGVDNQYVLITAEEIKLLLNRMNDNIVNKPLADIDVENISNQIKKIPEVLNADVTMSIEGKMKIRIVQRKPILRIESSNKKSYYLDETGILFRINPLHTTRITIANGYIRDSLKEGYSVSLLKTDSAKIQSSLFKLYHTAQFIQADSFLRAQVAQIWVNEKNELELIPCLGNHSIELGDIDRLEEKFRNLKVFYKQGISKVGWDKYRIINLKYKNQVVCTKF